MPKLPQWVWVVGLALVGYVVYQRWSATRVQAASAVTLQNETAQAYANVTGNPFGSNPYLGYNPITGQSPGKGGPSPGNGSGAPGHAHLLGR
jgi:hypothetical protein